MTTLYLTIPGSTLHRSGETLRLYIPPQETEPARKVNVPLAQVSQVIVVGNVTLTTQVLATLLEHQVSITYLSSHGRFLGQLGPSLGPNGVLRIAQHLAHHDPRKRMAIAQACVVGKLHNQRVLLQRYQRRQPHPKLAEAVSVLRRCEKEAETLSLTDEPPPDRRRPQAQSIWGSLFGLEGTGGAAYFRAFARLLPDEWSFSGRRRRPPTDPVNALLSFAYTLLHHQVLTAVKIVGFDPYVGFLHGSKYNKPALALDLMEEFRAIIADSVVLTLINKRILTLDDFEETLGAYRLNDKGKRRFFRQWERRLETHLRHPIFGYDTTYRRALVLQVRLLARHILGELKSYPPLLVR